ncbi:hypothetical protein C0971_07855 [Bacillus methanolicus]|nr:hypothetical protein C0971_07855 [Bacillus methanolicus]
MHNQFFTLRYVVEYLTDNTQGRIWYEMTQGETSFLDECSYLVKRPNEIFLIKGEEVSKANESTEDISQENLLNQPFLFRAILFHADLSIVCMECLA